MSHCFPYWLSQMQLGPPSPSVANHLCGKRSLILVCPPPPSPATPPLGLEGRWSPCGRPLPLADKRPKAPRLRPLRQHRQIPHWKQSSRSVVTLNCRRHSRRCCVNSKRFCCVMETGAGRILRRGQCLSLPHGRRSTDTGPSRARGRAGVRPGLGGPGLVSAPPEPGSRFPRRGHCPAGVVPSV